MLLVSTADALENRPPVAQFPSAVAQLSRSKHTKLRNKNSPSLQTPFLPSYFFNIKKVIAAMGKCGNIINLVLLSGNFPHDMAAVAARTPVAAAKEGPPSPLWTDDIKPPGSATTVSPSLRTLVITRGTKRSLGMALTETGQG